MSLYYFPNYHQLLYRLPPDTLSADLNPTTPIISHIPPFFFTTSFKLPGSWCKSYISLLYIYMYIINTTVLFLPIQSNTLLIFSQSRILRFIWILTHPSQKYSHQWEQLIECFGCCIVVCIIMCYTYCDYAVRETLFILKL